jgi:hypothetical protein
MRTFCVHAIALGGWLVLAAGCGQKATPEAPAPPAEAAPTLTQTATTTAPAAPPEVAPPAVATAPQPAEAPKAATTNAPVSQAAKVDEIINAALKLVAEKKWPEVLQKVGELKDLPLTPEQEKSLLALKTELERMVQEALGK